MREKISLERAREVLDYDPLTGIFKWKITLGVNAKAGGTAGTNSNTYRAIRVDGTIYRAHRLAWFMAHGYWPNKIDHRNGRGTDNRIENLRDVTVTQNAQNMRKAHKDSTSGLLGVSWSKYHGKWRAQIAYGGKNRFIGMFDNPEEAYQAYLLVKRQQHETCTI